MRRTSRFEDFNRHLTSLPAGAAREEVGQEPAWGPSPRPRMESSTKNYSGDFWAEPREHLEEMRMDAAENPVLFFGTCFLMVTFAVLFLTSVL